MKQWLAIIALVIWPAAALADDLPGVVSLDSCSDQLVLALAGDGQILALSADATGPFSYFGERAARFPHHQGTVEEILLLGPDIVLSTGAGDPGLVQTLEGLGVKVVRTGLPGTIEAAVSDLRTIGGFLHQEALAADLAASAEHQLAALKSKPRLDLTAIYVSPSGITTGAGTFLDQVIALSGLDNLMAGRGAVGWASFDVESFIALGPDIVITSFFDSQIGFAEGWRFSEHPAVEAAISEARIIDVPSRYLSCPAWYATEGAALIRKSLEGEGGP